MPALLVLALVVVPLLELAVIIQVGQVIGTGWTIALLVANSLAGAYLLKRESRRAWQDFRSALSAGRWPGDEVTQGGLIIVGGALLLTPGFATDAVGLAALLPLTRRAIARIIRRRVVPEVLGSGAGRRRQRAGTSRDRRRTGSGRQGSGEQVPGRTAGTGRTGRGPTGPATGGHDPGAHPVLDVEVVDIEREPREGPDA